MPFSALFGLILVLTIGGSLYAFNVITGSDHLVEFGLSVLLLLFAFFNAALVRSPLSRGLLLLTGLAALVAGLAFVSQAIPSAQLPAFLPPSVTFNWLFTGGLAVAAIISLFWLTRPFAVVDRLVLIAIFGIAGICTVIQYPGGDGDVSKHLLLLVTLITLILGVLVAAQMERVRTSTSGT